MMLQSPPMLALLSSVWGMARVLLSFTKSVPCERLIPVAVDSSVAPSSVKNAVSAMTNCEGDEFGFLCFISGSNLK